ncbi:MAG: hypothetical protein AAF849_05410 [Bacteroidota bacterium]
MNTTVNKKLTLERLQKEDQIIRLCLIGSGIVCGLELCVDDNFGIQVRTGNGITSNGHYIEIDRTYTLRYYRSFKKEGYPLFEQASEVWELLESPETDAESLHPQNEEEGMNLFLREKVVLLYLSPQQTAEGDLHHQLHFLLMSQEDVMHALRIGQLATRLLWERLDDDNDFIYNSDYNPDDERPNIDILNLSRNPAYRLPELYLRRLGFNDGDAFNCPEDVDIDASVFPEIGSLQQLYDAYCPIIDEAAMALDAALRELTSTFGNLMNCKDQARVTAWIDELCLKWEAFKMEQAEASTPDSLIPDKRYYIQYFYDWMRDLIQGYNELRQDLMNLVNECCPNPDEFPRHLFLGIAFRHELSRQPQPLRHHFQQPPIYNGNADRLQRIRLYCWRELMMIKTFYLPDYIQNPKINTNVNTDLEEFLDFSKVKITPSRFYDAPLAEQSIPFYYPLSWDKHSVHYFWNYERTKTSSTDQLLSYHAADLEGESYTLLPNAVRPLHYRLDRYSFFRVEGHIGQNLADIKSTLSYLKQKYNLPIDVKDEAISNLTKIHSYTPPQGGASESYISFKSNLLGMEHLAGTKEYGTFYLIHSGNPEIVIADFFLPNCKRGIVNPDLGGIPGEYDLVVPLKKENDFSIASLGKSDASNKDDLTKIKGIGPKYEQQLNDLGIYTYEQVSKMTNKEYEAVDELLGGVKGNGKRYKWAEQAKKLL